MTTFLDERLFDVDLVGCGYSLPHRGFRESGSELRPRLRSDIGSRLSTRLASGTPSVSSLPAIVHEVAAVHGVRYGPCRCWQLREHVYRDAKDSGQDRIAVLDIQVQRRLRREARTVQDHRSSPQRGAHVARLHRRSQGLDSRQEGFIAPHRVSATR